MSEIGVTECPDCSQKGTYEARILINGRGVYTCPEGHRWQNADEKPSNKGVPLSLSAHSFVEMPDSPACLRCGVRYAEHGARSGG